MTNEELVAYLEGLGQLVETLQAPNGARYIVVRNYSICTGRLKGEVRDIAVMWSPQTPYVMHSSMQVRPTVVQMGTANSQASPLGGEWQYLSRVLRGQPTPQRILAHINTVLSEI